MRSKVVVGLLMVLVAVFFISSVATAQGSAKLLCVSKKELKGEETVASCLAKGERFAVVDPYGMVRILIPGRSRTDQGFQSQSLRDPGLWHEIFEGGSAAAADAVPDQRSSVSLFVNLSSVCRWPPKSALGAFSLHSRFLCLRSTTSG